MAGGPFRYGGRQAGKNLRTPSGKLEFHSEQLAAARTWRRCRTGGPIRQEEQDAARWPLRLLTAPGYFQAHTAYLRGRVPAPGARGRRTAYCTRKRRQSATSADGARVRLFNDRGTVGLALRVSDEVLPGVVLVPGQRPDRRGGRRAPSTCCARTATPTWAKARPTRAPGSMSGRGRRSTRSDLNSLPRHTGEVARRAGGGEPQLRSRLIPDLKFSRLPVGLSPSAPFGGTSRRMTGEVK